MDNPLLAAIPAMTGGVANRTWQRDRRGPDNGRIDLIEDVRAILARFRAEHGWQPGYAWDPYIGEYVPAPDPERIRT